MPQTRIADCPWGWIGTFDDNEIEIVSTIPDPPKVRLAVQAGKVESNLGAVSANIRREDGRHEEYGLAMFRLTADRQEGAAYLALRRRGHASVSEMFYIDPGAAIFRVPVVAPNLGRSSMAGTRIALRSLSNGRIVCAEMAGESALIANRDVAGPWETFEVIEVP